MYDPSYGEKYNKNTTAERVKDFEIASVAGYAVLQLERGDLYLQIRKPDPNALGLTWM
jgi:hypothetical protein